MFRDVSHFQSSIDFIIDGLWSVSAAGRLFRVPVEGSVRPLGSEGVVSIEDLFLATDGGVGGGGWAAFGGRGGGLGPSPCLYSSLLLAFVVCFPGCFPYRSSINFPLMFPSPISDRFFPPLSVLKASFGGLHCCLALFLWKFGPSLSLPLASTSTSSLSLVNRTCQEPPM